MWAAYDDPDDFRQHIQWEKKLYAKNSRKLLLALRRALLTLHDVSDSDGVVFSDDEIDVQTALRRFRDWKEHLWDPPLPWNQITSRTGDRRTSWMEDWIDLQLQNIDRQLDILPTYFSLRPYFTKYTCGTVFAWTGSRTYVLKVAVYPLLHP